MSSVIMNEESYKHGFNLELRDLVASKGMGVPAPDQMTGLPTVLCYLSIRCGDGRRHTLIVSGYPKHIGLMVDMLSFSFKPIYKVLKKRGLLHLVGDKLGEFKGQKSLIEHGPIFEDLPDEASN